MVRLALVVALAAAAPGAALAAPWQLDRSEVLSVRSSDGEEYQVMVAWPEGDAPPGGWPVLWVLDGEDNFAMAATTARRLARAGARSGVEPGVVVGIASGSLQRRARNFTPELPGYSIPAGTPGHGLPTGGADAFLSFFESGVRPLVEKRWPVAATRQTILGHSFGGLLALHELGARGGFSGYAAISPSLWYGKGAVVRRVESSAKLSDKRVLLAQADVERDSAASLEKLGAALAAGGAQVQTLPLAGQNHGSTMNAAIVQSVTFAFGKEKRP